MTREEIGEAFRAALARFQERKYVYRSYSEAERRAAWVEARELPRPDMSREYRPAETLAEWADDVVLLWGRPSMTGQPEAPLIVTLAEAARDSAQAAVKVLKEARTLEPAVQWVVYQNIGHWQRHDRAGRLGTDRLALALLAEWERLKLPVTDPAATPVARRRRRAWEALEAEAAS